MSFMVVLGLCYVVLKTSHSTAARAKKLLTVDLEEVIGYRLGLHLWRRSTAFLNYPGKPPQCFGFRPA